MSEKENYVDEPQDEDRVSDVAEKEGDPLADTVPDHVELTVLLEDARGKADEHWDQCLRLQAELDNLRKRSERELANAHKFALDRFANELLPVRDSLELGLAAFDVDNPAPDKLQEGVEMTLQMLTTALDKSGITEVNPVDESFDPEFHQAMSMQPRDDIAPNTVVTVVQKGYLLNGRLIRPALVIVSQAPV